MQNAAARVQKVEGAVGRRQDASLRNRGRADSSEEEEQAPSETGSESGESSADSQSGGVAGEAGASGTSSGSAAWSPAGQAGAGAP